MANTAGYFGFSQIGTASGAVNYAESHNPPYRISSANTTQIFYGDAVRLVAGGSPTGFITQWTAGDGPATQQVAGIFIGCTYFSTSRQTQVWSRYWPGSDASTDVVAHVCDDPQAQFKVQANSGPITQAMLGFGADIAATPVGVTSTGISGMSLATPSASSAATLPFKVVNIINSPPTANGADPTTAFNYVIVGFNNQLFKTQTGV